MKLVHGKGNPNKGACWMSAINYYVNENALADWHDHPDCVDPVVRALAITLNDMCHDGEREELIGPHLFKPVGTAGPLELTRKRMFRAADAAVREFAPIALEARGRKADADKLRALPPIVDKASAAAAYAATDATFTPITGAAAAAAAYAVSYAARGVATASASVAASAYAAADAAADAAATTYAYVARRAVKEKLLALILELCEMGRVESPTCHTKEQVLYALETGFVK